MCPVWWSQGSSRGAHLDMLISESSGSRSSSWRNMRLFTRWRPPLCFCSSAGLPHWRMPGSVLHIIHLSKVRHLHGVHAGLHAACIEVCQPGFSLSACTMYGFECQHQKGCCLQDRLTHQPQPFQLMAHHPVEDNRCLQLIWNAGHRGFTSNWAKTASAVPAYPSSGPYPGMQARRSKLEVRQDYSSRSHTDSNDTRRTWSTTLWASNEKRLSSSFRLSLTLPSPPKETGAGVGGRGQPILCKRNHRCWMHHAKLEGHGLTTNSHDHHFPPNHACVAWWGKVANDRPCVSPLEFPSPRCCPPWKVCGYLNSCTTRPEHISQCTGCHAASI